MAIRGRWALAPLALGLALFGVADLRAATYVVDQSHPAASDAGPGSADQPWKTLGKAAQSAAAGDLVLIRSGVYREKVAITQSGTAEKPIRFQADLAANVVVTGADRITEWRREESEDKSPHPNPLPRKGEGAGGVFSADWPYSFINHNATHTHPDDNHHLVIGRCEQVFVLGYQLQQVLSKDKLARGTFYVDLAGKRLYAWASDDANLSNRGVLVEASTRDALWTCKGDYVQLRGVRFRYAANMAQHGAAAFAGNHDVIEDCVFERTNSSGATFTGQDQVVRRCTFRDNGQLGFGANRAHRLLFTECTVTNNNVKNFSRGWEAGGDKLCFSRGVVLEKSRFVENCGCGVWFDIGNEEATIRNCLIADNEDAGIFYEISYGLHVQDNVIVGNGLAGTPGSWGAAAGVCLSSSPGCTVERNLIVGNKEGFNFREQTRGTPRIDDPKGGPVWNHDQVIRQNVLAYNRDAQTWGWFDMNDQRHWPKAMQEQKAEGGKAAEDIAKDYQAKGAAGVPAGLSLETLKLTFTGNLYATLPGAGAGSTQELFHWGVTWKRNVKYTSLDEVRKQLSLEQDSVCAPFVFGDYLTRDFRVPKGSPALRLGCYPRGEVPGVRLGVMEP